MKSLTNKINEAKKFKLTNPNPHLAMVDNSLYTVPLKASPRDDFKMILGLRLF